jgi:hypothetical protein
VRALRILAREQEIQAFFGIVDGSLHVEPETTKPRRNDRDEQRLDGLHPLGEIGQSFLDELAAGQGRLLEQTSADHGGRR